MMARGGLAPVFRRYQQGLVFGGAAAAFAAVSLVPLIATLLEPLREASAVSSLFAAPRTWALLLRSLSLSAAVTALSLTLGVPMGVLLGRTDIAGRRAAWLVHMFPMFLTPFLLALGWFHIFGRQGMLGSEESARLLFGEAGVVAVLSLSFTPIVTALTALGVAGVDASIEEAARVVARPARVVTHILLPPAWPALALAAMTVFALSLSELGVPMFLRVDVYAAAVFARLGGIHYAPGEALALALPLLLIALVLVLAERSARRGRSFAVLGLRGDAREPIPLGRLRVPLSTICWIVAVLPSAPIAALALLAARGGGFGELPVWVGTAPWNSIAMAMMAATLITALAVILGHAAARGARGGSALDALAVMVFVTPAPVLGVGLIAAWNRPSTQALYGSMGILVLGAVARYGVLGLRTVAASVAQSSPRIEEAAAASGAGYLRRILQVVVPIHSRGIFAAWLLALVFVLRDLEMAVLYYPPGLEPLTVRIFTLEANGPEPVVAALAVSHVALTGAALTLGAWLLLGRRRG